MASRAESEARKILDQYLPRPGAEALKGTMDWQRVIVTVAPGTWTRINVKGYAIAREAGSTTLAGGGLVVALRQPSSAHDYAPLLPGETIRVLNGFESFWVSGLGAATIGLQVAKSPHAVTERAGVVTGVQSMPVYVAPSDDLVPWNVAGPAWTTSGSFVTVPGANTDLATTIELPAGDYEVRAWVTPYDSAGKRVVLQHVRSGVVQASMAMWVSTTTTPQPHTVELGRMTLPNLTDAFRLRVLDAAAAGSWYQGQLSYRRVA